jgi:hypothetical protein
MTGDREEADLGARGIDLARHLALPRVAPIPQR